MDEIKPRFYNDVVIIGAGLSGINLACQLQRKLGVSDYIIYDRAQELGGAWAANKCKISQIVLGYNNQLNVLQIQDVELTYRVHSTLFPGSQILPLPRYFHHSPRSCHMPIAWRKVIMFPNTLSSRENGRGPYGMRNLLPGLSICVI